MLTDFQNAYNALRGQLTIKWLAYKNIAAHFNCVATVPYKHNIFKNY